MADTPDSTFSREDIHMKIPLITNIWDSVHELNYLSPWDNKQINKKSTLSLR